MRKSTPLSLNACSKSIMKNMEYCIQNNYQQCSLRILVYL